MPDTRFLAILPQKLEIGNAIRIRGTLEPSAQQFSINFANEICEAPSNISYHFKWDLEQKLLIEDYKDDGVWQDYKDSGIDSLAGPLNQSTFIKYNSINMRLTTNNLDNNAMPNTNSFIDTNALDNHNQLSDFVDGGGVFTLEFRFVEFNDRPTIFVYDEGHNNITYFTLQHPLSDIASIQVWDHVMKINELSFIYD